MYVASHDENGEEAFGEKVRRSGGRTAGENRREHRERSVPVSILLVADNVDSLSLSLSPRTRAFFPPARKICARATIIIDSTVQVLLL